MDGARHRAQGVSLPSRGRRIALVLAVVAVLVAGAPTFASEDMPVPLPVQAAMFSKIFAYVRTLDRQTVRVVIVYPPEQRAQLQTTVNGLRQAFHDAGLDAQGVSSDQLAGKLGKGAVAYVLPEAATPGVLDAVAGAKALSISGAPALAEAGSVSIAIGIKANKPEILVNTQRLKTEGQEISSQLMALARAVG